MPNLYQILNVSEDATEENIRKAYLKLAKDYHPDKHLNDSEDEQKVFAEKMKELIDAYNVLSDRDKRQEYDRSFNSHLNTNPFASFNVPQHFNSSNSQTTQYYSFTTNHNGTTFSYSTRSPANHSATFFSSPFAMNTFISTQSILINKLSPKRLLSAIANAALMDDIIGILNESSYSIFDKDILNNTPLHLAVIVGRPDLSKLINMLYFRNPEQASTVNFFDATPFQMAKLSGLLEAIQTLKDLKLDKEFTSRSTYKVF